MDHSSDLIKGFAIKQLKEEFPERRASRIEINSYFLAKAGIRLEYNGEGPQECKLLNRKFLLFLHDLIKN